MLQTLIVAQDIYPSHIIHIINQCKTVWIVHETLTLEQKVINILSRGLLSDTVNLNSSLCYSKMGEETGNVSNQNILLMKKKRDRFSKRVHFLIVKTLRKTWKILAKNLIRKWKCAEGELEINTSFRIRMSVS